MKAGQDAFVAALMAPEAEVPEGLSDPVGRPAGKRFDVYRNNVIASLTEALETAFPVIRKLLGEGNFKVLAGAYIRQHPPRSPLMMHYGADLAGFLESWEPARSLGYLPDMARLEQALRAAYHAADAAAIDPARLSELSPDALASTRVRLAPALRVVRSRWPLHAIWLYNTAPGSPKPAARAEDVVVVRPAFDPEPLPLPAGGAAFIDALSAGRPLCAAAEAASSETRDFDLASILGLLLASNAIAALEIEP